MKWSKGGSMGHHIGKMKALIDEVYNLLKKNDSEGAIAAIEVYNERKRFVEATKAFVKRTIERKE